MRSIKRFQSKRLQAGFTLSELIIAAAMGVSLSIVAVDMMVSQIQANARAESLQRQREDWQRTTSFIESEIAMSSRIWDGTYSGSIPDGCDLTNDEVRLALDLSRSLPLVIYGVRELTSAENTVDRTQWLGEGQDGAGYGVLIRCGPNLKITADGGDDYDNSKAAIQNIILDGIDTEANGGFYTKVHNSKSASFTLSLKALANSRFSSKPASFKYSLGSGSYSRVNPVATFPEEDSACARLCGVAPDTGERGCKDIGAYYAVPVSTTPFTIPYEGLTEEDNITVCSLIAQSSITGGNRNDVIDGLMPSPGSTPTSTVIIGGDGRNMLFGTPGADTLNGGAGDDVIVGRGGGDTMIGGDGNNRYSPWPSLQDPSLLGLSDTVTTTITGGSGLDVVYLRGNKNEFSMPGTCTKTGGCTITPVNTSLKLALTLNSGIDVVVFKDARVDLP
ncbi:MAG: hypothetical protein QUV04_07345 [Synechococcus sp. WH 8007]|nr:hypothetical protein [Synechococcus sp. WH 8007]